METYWKDLVSTALRVFQEQNNTDSIFVIKNSTLAVEFNNHDNWNGGIDYWDIVFQLNYRDFTALGDKKNTVESNLLTTLERLHSDRSNPIANVIIKPHIERFIDWQAVIPNTKESVIQQIGEEKDLLTAVATGKSYKDDGVEKQYQERHRYICSMAKMAGFEYPVNSNSLAEWWLQIKAMGSYSERRAYISRIFAPVLEQLNKSDDAPNVSFDRITSQSDTIQKAIEDATLFMREGKYDSAVDRVHTAFHGYLRQLLINYCVAFAKDDGLPALYNKLHEYYGSSIQPQEVAVRIKTTVRSAIGVVNSINELRNNNTVAHPNGELIQKREAQLVIRLVNAIVDYIEDIEKTMH